MDKYAIITKCAPQRNKETKAYENKECNSTGVDSIYLGDSLRRPECGNGLSGAVYLQWRQKPDRGDRASSVYLVSGADEREGCFGR